MDTKAISLIALPESGRRETAGRMGIGDPFFPVKSRLL
jgi:hypothetical protein